MKKNAVVKIAIAGAGGHGKVIYDILRVILGSRLEIRFFDNAYPNISPIQGIKISGKLDALLSQDWEDYVFVAIGDNHTRSKVVEKCSSSGKRFLSVFHPFTAISPQANIGLGSVAVAGAVVNAEAVVGQHVILNTHSSVGHDCRIEDFAQLAPGVNLGGGVQVDKGAFLGIGAKVAPMIKIGAWSVIGAGAVVLDDCIPETFYRGVPAQPVKRVTPGSND